MDVQLIGTPARFGLNTLTSSLRARARALRRAWMRVDDRIASGYFENHPEPKLQIGGSWHLLEGWLNTDIEPIPGAVQMDATRCFPFADAAFAYVFTEHMIEHVPYEQGARMLAECHRVLRKGGVLRVATPDLARIAGLYSDHPTAAQQRYLDWFCETFVPAGQPKTRVAAINAHFRLWGHQFIYDEATLADALRAAGFTSVTKHPLGESAHPALSGLENTQRYPDGLLDFESLALEASK
jgi:predicted SAM-dependent methyltransferase